MRDPVLTAEEKHTAGKLSLKLIATIGLDGIGLDPLHKAAEPARHRKAQECLSVHGQKTWA